MKYLALTLLLFLSPIIWSQNTDQNAYPEHYTLGLAEKFWKQQNYQKATWILINCFPDTPFEVFDKMEQLSKILDTTDIRRYILNAFVTYATEDPVCVTVYNGKAQINFENMMTKGNWGDMLIAWFDPDERNKALADAFNYRGLARYKESDEKALRDFDSAVLLNPMPKYYFNRAYARSDFKQYDGAIADYNFCISEGYKPANSYFERGYCKMHLDQNDEALKDYHKAIKLDKNFVDAINNAGIIYLKQSNFKKALKLFNKAIKIAPDMPNGYMNRGFAYDVMKKHDKACSDWRKALELGFEPAGDVLRQNCQ